MLQLRLGDIVFRNTTNIREESLGHLKNFRGQAQREGLEGDEAELWAYEHAFPNVEARHFALQGRNAR